MVCAEAANDTSSAAINKHDFMVVPEVSDSMWTTISGERSSRNQANTGKTVSVNPIRQWIVLGVRGPLQ